MYKLLCPLLLVLSLPALALSQTTKAQCDAATAAPSVQIASGIVAPVFTDTAPINGTVYGYVVTAVDMAGQACSNIVQNVVIPATGTHTVGLSWNPSTTVGVTYAVFRASAPSNPSALAATVN